jgi:hypothetical protein
MKNLCATTGAALLICGGLGLRAQTAIDLGRQGRNIDFGNAAGTRPSQTGTTLPAACSVGQTFFKSDAQPGANWYGCSASNTWTVQGGGGTGASTVSQLLDFGVTRIGPQQLSIGARCSSAVPCLVRLGSRVLPFSGAVVFLTGGTGTAWIYFDGTGAMTVGNNLSVTCDSGCQQIGGITSFPDESTPLFSWTATAGSWDNNGTDYRAVFSRTILTAGPGVILSDSGNATQISLDTLALLTVAGNNSFTGANTFANAQSTVPARTGTALPATCGVGEVFFQTNALPGQNLYFCTTANAWTQMAAGSGGGNGGGQVALLASSNSFTGANNFTNSVETAPAKTGQSLPATCTVGDFYFLTTAQPGQNLNLCTDVNTWSSVSGGSSSPGGGPRFADLGDSPSATGIFFTPLKTYTLPAGTWTANNQFGHIHAWGIATTPGSSISLQFGSTVVAGPPNANGTNLPIDINCTIGRTGPATEKSVCVVIFGQNIASYNYQTAPAEDLSNNIVISVLAANGAGNAGEVIVRGLTVE